MFRILESQAPVKQTATDTINTLTNRLQSATLLEDRRAAIQGLRSFAKIYPASVASGALRSLISSLRNDREDVDTLKVVLETLLMLFSPDASSPEASDEIALWLSDEFTQRQDNITALLDLLDTRDFYSRLYSLQLMFQISSARPERTQECILTAPLGIPRLVSALGDAREPVRNEALLLLIALTPASEELQKLVAFENAFETICSLIESEGGLVHGSEVIEDCLSLLANLLRLNIPNQSYFRETGCIQRLAKLLADVNREEDPEEPTPQWALAHRDKNVWGLLVIVQLFLVKGGVNTPTNQMAFWNTGLMEQILSTAFGQRFTVNVTAKALATCADLIRGNQPLQERFGDVEVFWGAGQANDGVNGNKAKPLPRINVIEALLKLSLEPAPIQLLDARLAACDCVKAFFTNHTGIRVHVLGRAINGHVSGQDEIPNILTVLLTPPDLRGNADPYQTWMASILMFHLLYENTEAKSVAMGVTEGDAENGEEVITCIQTIAGNLITGIQRGDDERISLGYLMLLCGWLFEDPDAVNDFLGEGSSIQTLLQETKHRGAANVLVPGLCTILLGIIYEFSSKDSPIPRKTLHKLLLEQLGREQYIDKITRLRESPLVRDFEVLPQTIGANYEGGLPDIFFDRVFVEFLKDNFSRLTRAIDREPGLEISVITNGVERGVSRELVDSLKSEVEERNQLVQKLESELVSLRHRLDHELAEHRKSRDSSGLEFTKLQQSYDALQKRYEQELAASNEQHKQAKNELLKQHGEQLRAIDAQLRETSADYERKSAKFKERHEAEVADLQKKIRSLESELAHVRDQYGSETRELKAHIEALKSEADRSREQHAAEVAGLNSTIQDVQLKAGQAEQYKSEVAELQAKLETLNSETGQSREKHASEVADLNKIINDVQSKADKAEQYESEVAQLQLKVETLQSEVESTKERHASEASDLEKTVQDLQSRLDTTKQKHESEIAKLESANETIQSELNTLKEQSTQDIEAVREDYNSKCSALENRAQQAESEVERLEAEARKTAQALEEAQMALEKARAETKEKEEARQSAQSELEDLLIVFGDLETKRNEDKKRLKELGEEVSEDEDDEEEEEDE
ncbi:putative intracellular protein transport protein (UsoA) [Aspergillus mulundensis]|uniref:UsoAp n=1 Tax=Aspergillus mulundensis TaxID=1810919 RepID=A0A3D8SUC7_9EURO|nr:UsoAp [Aspergillus mulundensis]RDW89909.1 UsoAp [Aspergillus mulundensis]